MKTNCLHFMVETSTSAFESRPSEMPVRSCGHPRAQLGIARGGGADVGPVLLAGALALFAEAKRRGGVIRTSGCLSTSPRVTARWVIISPTGAAFACPERSHSWRTRANHSLRPAALGSTTSVPAVLGDQPAPASLQSRPSGEAFERGSPFKRCLAQRRFQIEGLPMSCRSHHGRAPTHSRRNVAPRAPA